MTTSDPGTIYYEDVPPGTLNEEEFICTERIVPRKIKPQNIVIRLMDREIYGSRKPGSHFHVVREFYQNVFPNLTIVNVEKPPCFLRKFSPDGKHFIAFSADQTSLEIFEYRGASAAGHLVAGYPSDLLNADANAHHRIRTHIFYNFFKPKFIVNVCQQRVTARSERNPGQLPFIEQQLNRECSLFTEDGRYVIVGSAAHIPDDLRPHFYHIHSNNEAVTPTIRSALEDYSLHLVDLHQGKLCDTKHFRIDKIYLSHNQVIILCHLQYKPKNARLCADSQFTCSPSNNLYARLTQQRFKQTIVRAIYGGRTEATKRILAQLPISAQSYSGSPYLDLGLFSYDDKWVSVMERPKAYGEYPIRFYARDSGLLKFKIYAGVMGQSVPASARRLVAFTFHPTDPFAISVQRTNSDYIVNFHIRNAVFS
ncbi:unnamed protein product, partial [Iphiclides podalirius]